MKEYNRKYYDMYNGVKGSQKSFKDIDGDWGESPLISIDNTLHQKSKAADILSCHVEKAILFASNNGLGLGEGGLVGCSKLAECVCPLLPNPCYTLARLIKR